MLSSHIPHAAPHEQLPPMLLGIPNPPTVEDALIDGNMQSKDHLDLVTIDAIEDAKLRIELADDRAELSIATEDYWNARSSHLQRHPEIAQTAEDDTTIEANPKPNRIGRMLGSLSTKNILH